jgi:acyl-CoA thioester hydrolase
MGVVYHANYLVWFEIGRTDLLRTIGWSYRQMEATGVLLPVIEAHCEYRKPCRYDDELEVITRGELLSPTRVCFNYEIRWLDGEASAIGRTVHAAINVQRRPCRLPEQLSSVFA